MRAERRILGKSRGEGSEGRHFCEQIPTCVCWGPGTAGASSPPRLSKVFSRPLPGELIPLVDSHLPPPRLEASTAL